MQYRLKRGIFFGYGLEDDGRTIASLNDYLVEEGAVVDLVSVGAYDMMLVKRELVHSNNHLYAWVFLRDLEEIEEEVSVGEPPMGHYFMVVYQPIGHSGFRLPSGKFPVVMGMERDEVYQQALDFYHDVRKAGSVFTALWECWKSEYSETSQRLK